MTAAKSVLHVEDDDATALLVKLALLEVGTVIEYARVASVDAAVRLLPMNDTTGGIQLPDLILLDLNLPPRSGFELLTLIRSSKHLQHLRVVILTASSASGDRKKAMSLGADDYIAKASTFDEYVAQLRVLTRPPPQGALQS